MPDAPKVEMVPVESTNLASVGYDAAHQELHVAFKAKKPGEAPRTYVHTGVPAAEHKRLMAAVSHGGYYNAHIKGAYTQYRVEESR